MKKSQWLEKPTDNRLRNQIIFVDRVYNICFIVGVITFGILWFKNMFIASLITLSFFIIMAYMFLLSQKLDKIRLEIRER